MSDLKPYIAKVAAGSALDREDARGAGRGTASGGCFPVETGCPGGAVLVTQFSLARGAFFPRAVYWDRAPGRGWTLSATTDARERWFPRIWEVDLCWTKLVTRKESFQRYYFYVESANIYVLL